MSETPKHVSPLVWSLLGIVLAGAAASVIIPLLGPATVDKVVIKEKEVPETKTVRKTVTVNGKNKVIDVPVEVRHKVQERKTEPVVVEPTAKEKLWLYGMLGVGGFLAVFSVATAIAWFYFLVRKSGGPPAVLTEMLKYLVSSFVGVFVGFLGGSAVGTEKQAHIDKPEAVSKAHD